MTLPNDPVILLSFINTQLRDYYHTLDDLCMSMSISKEELINKLKSLDYQYSETNNQFI